MSKRYDEAAAEARARVREAGKKELARLAERHPVGQEVLVGEGGELKRRAFVKGHELNTFYKPLVVTTEGVFYAYEAEDFIKCRICEAMEHAGDEGTEKCRECGALVCEAHFSDGYCDMCN